MRSHSIDTERCQNSDPVRQFAGGGTWNRDDRGFRRDDPTDNFSHNLSLGTSENRNANQIANSNQFSHDLSHLRT
jgi:hypothetical protein